MTRRELSETHEALRRAQGQLVQYVHLRALSLLVASVAHEANNPLAFAAAGVEEADRLAEFALRLLDAYRSRMKDPGETIAALEADPDAAYLDDLRGTLADARDGIERVRTLVLDLRTFARVDESERKFVDLAATLRATLRVGCTAVPEGVRIEVDLPEIPPIECEPSRVNQSVLSLIANAAHAAAPRGIVRIRLRDSVDKAVVEVEDSGPGVPLELRERVFEPSFTTHAADGGLGLGLHTARDTARPHGGGLSVSESELGGARFCLTLPREISGILATAR